MKEIKLKNVFTREEALAVARLVWMMIFSDAVVHKKESEFFDGLLHTLNLTMDQFRTFLDEREDKALEQVRSMTYEKRKECGILLRISLNIDDSVELSELTRLNDILDRAGILRPDPNAKKKEELNLN